MQSKTKIVFDKDVTVYIKNKVENESRYASDIELFQISIGIKPVHDYRNEKIRIDFDGQWYEYKDTNKKVVIALKCTSKLYISQKHDDSALYEAEVIRLYRKFCEKYSDMMQNIECEKQRFLIFINRQFDAREFHKWESFTANTWPQRQRLIS